MTEYEYAVATSYASEQRDYVKQVANLLKAKGVKVFYDEFEEARLWGKDLVTRFQEVYYAKSQWCMMFISKEYISKAWPSQERQFALDRQLKERGNYIIPVRFDDSEVPGLSTSIHAVDARTHNPEQLVALFLEMSGL